MITYRNVIRILLPAIAVLFSACAGMEGRLGTPTTGAPDIQELIENHQDYRVYFAGRAIHLPTALVFDPRGDDLQLTFHEHWQTVADPHLMKEVVDWMSLDHRYRPTLYEITGKDGKRYGYIYSNQTGIPITSPAPGILRLGSVHPTRWDFISDSF